ncbi:MAG: type IV pilus twitching motility protein PilT [Planctomycetota bacterium]|jgi:twitching motility protein PilT
MTLEELVRLAARYGASDLHVECGLPVVARVRGQLRPLPAPGGRAVSGGAGAAVTPEQAAAMVAEVLGPGDRERLLEQRSADKALTLAGQRCRVNVLHTARGLGLAIRLLPSTDVSLETLNLHPTLAALVEPEHGLVIVSGPTGCGKSSTLAALVQEINRTRARHVVTVEHPVEFDLRPQRAFIRQREVGRDTPSFAQGLMDAMREDIDVLMVGELRDRETMRLTLDACETGHLVLTTMHSATVVEALQRIVAAFPAGEQPSVCAQLADVLVGVVSQRLTWVDGAELRVPECEILMGSTPVRSVLRQGQLFKLVSVMETGAKSGMFTRERYRTWMAGRSDWKRPRPAATSPRPLFRAEPPAEPAGRDTEAAGAGGMVAAEEAAEHVIEIPPQKGTLRDIVSELEQG